MPKHAPKGKIKGDDPKGTADPKGGQTWQRCSAHSRTSGRQCGQRAILGGTVCHYHGGAAPQVKAKALDRLMALQHPAIDTLEYLMEQRQTFPSTAYAAARDVLDRTEGKAIERQQQEVKAEVRIKWKD